jgi:two-component system chemotaxis response regulator CheB
VRIAAFGASWGGILALQTILRALPREFRGPVALVQHRAYEKNDTLVSLLQACTSLSVIEADDKEPCREGSLYLAPADYHLLYDDGHWALSGDAAVSFSRPSIDVLFESIARGFGAQATAVLLTGANTDGAAGLHAVYANGGRVVVQDPATAEVRFMPQAGLDAVPQAAVLALEAIAGFVARQ